MMRRTHKQSGFTLIELLLAIAIMAILAALAAPLFGDNDALQLDSAKRLLISDLEYTQILAITNPDKAIGLVFDEAGTGWHIASLDDPLTPLIDSISGDPLLVEFGKGTAIYIVDVTISTNAAKDCIEYDMGGGLSNFMTDAEITLTTATGVKIVTIDPITGSIH